MFILTMKKSKKLSEQNAPHLCSHPPSSLPPPQPPSWGWVMGSVCRAPPSSVHPHEGAPMRSCYNSFIFEAKSLICSLVGAFLLLSRGYLVLVPSLFRSSAVVNVHFLCPISASVLSSCYSWYLWTWNCLQLEFSDNHRLKPSYHYLVIHVGI